MKKQIVAVLHHNIIIKMKREQVVTKIFPENKPSIFSTDQLLIALASLELLLQAFYFQTFYVTSVLIMSTKLSFPAQDSRVFLILLNTKKLW